MPSRSSTPVEFSPRYVEKLGEWAHQYAVANHAHLEAVGRRDLSGRLAALAIKIDNCPDPGFAAILSDERDRVAALLAWAQRRRFVRELFSPVARFLTKRDLERLKSKEQVLA